MNIRICLNIDIQPERGGTKASLNSMQQTAQNPMGTKNATKTRILTHCFFCEKKTLGQIWHVSKSCNGADPPPMLVRGCTKAGCHKGQCYMCPAFHAQLQIIFFRVRMPSSTSSSKRENCLSDHRRPHASVSVALTVMDLFFLLSLFLALFMFLLKWLM